MVAAAVAIAGAVSLLVTLAPGAAWAQACCVGTGLVTPARLRIFEDYGAGVQTRVRSVMGSFDPGGGYAAAHAGNDEVDLEQDFLAAARVGPHFQAALKLPFVETGRRATGVSAFGGGLGDVAGNLRYDITFAGDDPRWPGVALLAGLSAPTGRTVEESGDPTSATGIGSFEGSAGVAVEQVIGRTFLSLTGIVSRQTARTVGPVTQSFGPRVTALLAGGYAFANEVTLGAFFSAMRRSDQALVTGGRRGGGAARRPLAGAGDAVGRSAVLRLGPQPAHRRRAHGIAAARLVVAAISEKRHDATDARSGFFQVRSVASWRLGVSTERRWKPARATLAQLAGAAPSSSVASSVWTFFLPLGAAAGSFSSSSALVPPPIPSSVSSTPPQTVM